MNIYEMKYQKIVSEYIKINEFPVSINEKAVLLAEFQFLDREVDYIKVSDYGGVEYPDYLEEKGVHLFSDKFKSVLDKEGVMNIFYKPVRLIDDSMNRNELYWLAVSDRIEALDKEKSVYDDDLSFKVLKNIVIDLDKIGNYEVFQLKEDGSFSFFVTERIKEIIENNKLEGIFFNKLF